MQPAMIRIPAERTRTSRGTNLPTSPGEEEEAPHPHLPDDVVLVPQVEFLPVLPGAVDHPGPGHEIDDLLGRRVVKVVAALVTPVAINPLQSQVAVRGAPVSHGPPGGRPSLCPLAKAGGRKDGRRRRREGSVGRWPTPPSLSPPRICVSLRLIPGRRHGPSFSLRRPPPASQSVLRLTEGVAADRAGLASSSNAAARHGCTRRHGPGPGPGASPTIHARRLLGSRRCRRGEAATSSQANK